MFDYEDDDLKRREKKEEEKFQELYQKQMKVSKLILLLTFLPLGVVFFIVGLAILSYDKGFFVFVILGAVFIILGILLFLCMPKKGNYARYKKNIHRFGGMNTYSMAIQLGILEERVKTLERENQDLQSQIRDLDRKMNR